MSEKFDVKVQANSLSKLMNMAEFCLSQPGGAIHTERLIDYASAEFARLTIEQCLDVLAEIDKDYEKRLFRDGYGGIIGYAHAKKIFVTLRRDTESSEAASIFAKEATKLSKSKVKKSTKPAATVSHS